jgi:hypothetical protein
MESLFSFDKGWKLENGGSHQISRAQTMYDETGASRGGNEIMNLALQWMKIKMRKAKTITTWKKKKIRKKS